MTALASTSCNFDSGLCWGWHQSIADVFNWTINTGSTWSSDTGPDYDHTSGLGMTKIHLLPLILISFKFAEFRRTNDAVIRGNLFNSMSVPVADLGPLLNLGKKRRND